MKYFSYSFFMFCIVLLGFSVRIYNLQNNPPGFFTDEASIGYNAFTILNFGADETGRLFPLFFFNYGDFFRPGISIYFTAIPMLFFGISEFSTRVSAAIIGTVTILLTYSVTTLLFKNKNIGLIAAVFLSISPWHIHFSRINQEFVYFCFFVMLGLWVFLMGIAKKDQILLALSGVIFGIGIYTYVVSYFITPLFFIAIILIYLQVLLKMKKGFIFALFFFIALSIPLIMGGQNGKTFSRLNHMNESLKEKPINKVVNKFTYSYLRHFSYSFLFQKGDIDEPGHFITRFSVRGTGQLYLLQLPFILLGIIFAFKHYRKSFFVLVSWLVLYPFGSSVAPFSDGGGPFAMRSIIGVLPFQILSAAGIFYLVELIKITRIKIITCILLIALISFSFLNYTYKYFKEYPFYSADFWGWQYGPREIMNIFLNEQDKYDELIIAGSFNSPNIFIRFYDPKNICQNKCVIGSISNYNPSKKQLFAIESNKMQEIQNITLDVKQIIYYPNRQPAFFIGELKDGVKLSTQ